MSILAMREPTIISVGDPSGADCMSEKVSPCPAEVYEVGNTCQYPDGSAL